MAFDPSLCGFGLPPLASGAVVVVDQAMEEEEETLPPMKRKLTFEDVFEEQEEERRICVEPKQRERPNMWCGGGGGAGVLLPEVEHFLLPTPPSLPLLDPNLLRLPPSITQETMMYTPATDDFHNTFSPHLFAQAEEEDPRRSKFLGKSKSFPMAGLMREEGGIFGFLDKMKKKA